MPVLDLPDLDATARLACMLAPLLRAGDVLCLDGPLGAGKTTLVRALVAALDGDPATVASPTFTLLHCYPARLPVVHVDAYRLAGPGGLDGIGFDESREGGIAAVEWAERVQEALPRDGCWRITLTHAGEGRRLAEVIAPADRTGAWLQVQAR